MESTEKQETMVEGKLVSKYISEGNDNKNKKHVLFQQFAA
jgi:hypothetical protein